MSLVFCLLTHRRLQLNNSVTKSLYLRARSTLNSTPRIFSSKAFSPCSSHDPGQLLHVHQVPITKFSTAVRTTPDADAESELDNNNNNSDLLSIEERYSRKSPLEHVLLRPSMYIGATERSSPSPSWTLSKKVTLPPYYNSNELSSFMTQKPQQLAKPLSMQMKDCGIVPALLKVVDEILVNASDHRLRHNTCTRIDVYIHPGGAVGDDKAFAPPLIAVRNNGPGIPIEWHNDERMYVPTLLFGHLMTGSNFDDSIKRVTGGRHGYGAKLTNIFAREFTVETVHNGKVFQQTWRNNMHECEEAVIQPAVREKGKKAEEYTLVSFVPDLERLTQTTKGATAPLSPIDYAILCKRVIDIAGCSAGKAQITLNGYDVSFASFADYLQLYRSATATAETETPPLNVFRINDRWQVGIGLSQSGSFESISFVNGMCTTRGGTHVNAFVQQVVKRLQEHIHRIEPNLVEYVTASLIRRCLFVAIDSLIENPTFDSQMKEYLTSSPQNFGSSFDIPDKVFKQLIVGKDAGGPGIVEEIIQLAQTRQQSSLFKQLKATKRSRRHLLSIPKLEDAHNAGTVHSPDCTLILTEGDSAKALAVAGLEVVGRTAFGVFPLRGKFLNVRVASLSQLENNAEVKALFSILGLDFDKDYSTVEERHSLRYGRVMIMADQDTDGSHIKGLVINFFRCFWPGLLKPPVDMALDKNYVPFLSSFVTPLIKATKKGKKTKVLSFYSMAEYNDWRSSQPPGELKDWNIKYYKGLGTSTPAEAKEYFKNYSNHYRPFTWSSDADGELLDMAFDRTRAADRRSWLLETSTNHSEPDLDHEVSFEDFINKEMIHFSHYDNIRSIPSAIDGLKPSQRKVLYACFKRNLKNEIKVAQLSGYCAEHSAYHHGEASLQSTIIGMAQDFVGSNNLNLLIPSGQFGTRLIGGDDAASPRYIYTRLDPIARALFPEVDDVLLNYLEDDGQMIEPDFYCPIIPLLLVNGSQGIGTGWSTFIPPHKALDVIDHIRRKLDAAADFPKLRPHARGFQGAITDREDGKGYVTHGCIKRVSNDTVLISELPLGVWTSRYKEVLLKMRSRGEIRNFVENHTTTKVSFKVSMSENALRRLEKQSLEKVFRLTSNVPTTNMHAFCSNGKIKKFNCAEEVVDEYYPVRHSLYNDRKSVLESEIRYAHAMMNNKSKFIRSVITGDVNLLTGRKSKSETASRLRELGFDSHPQLQIIRNNNVLWERKHENSKEKTVETNLDTDYDYLLNMPLSTLTSDKTDELNKEAVKKEENLREVVNTTSVDMWRTDLEKLAKMV